MIRVKRCYVENAVRLWPAMYFGGGCRFYFTAYSRLIDNVYLFLYNQKNVELLCYVHYTESLEGNKYIAEYHFFL